MKSFRNSKLNLMLTVLLILMVAAGCQNQNAAEELKELKEQMKIKAEKLETNKKIVKRAHSEVWNKGNIEIIDELYSKEYIAHWATGQDTNLDEFKKMLIKTRNALPDLKEEIIHIVAEGDLVVTHFISSGTLTGSLDGIPPTGKKGSRPEIAVHKIKDGKIVEQWTVADLLSLLNQLGVKL